MNEELLKLYNYEIFSPETYEPWMKFDQSPAIGSQAPDFTLWNLEKEPIILSEYWKNHKYLIIEFGSFT